MENAEPEEPQPVGGYLSFLVRVWIKREPALDAGTHSEVQLIQSGETWRFSHFEDALSLMTKQVELILD